MKIFISTTSFGKFNKNPLQILLDSGLNINLNPYKRKVSQNELTELASHAVGIIAGTEVIDRSVLKKLPKLRVISRCGAGMENVDLKTAEELGIKIFNTPFGPTLAVAELALGLILNSLRKISQMDRELREGNWHKKMGNLLQNKRVGIIGFGKIGQKVAELLLPFGVEISYCDISNISCSLNCKPLNLENLLSWADIITLHLSISPKDKPIIGTKQLKLMKPGSWLINMARGNAVDEHALYNALKSGHLSSAALDVFSQEPYKGKLTELNNVILTPHIGSYAVEARTRMEMEAAQNLLQGLGLAS